MDCKVSSNLVSRVRYDMNCEVSSDRLMSRVQFINMDCKMSSQLVSRAVSW